MWKISSYPLSFAAGLRSGVRSRRFAREKFFSGPRSILADCDPPFGGPDLDLRSSASSR